jgi:hypothetical protein
MDEVKGEWTWQGAVLLFSGLWVLISMLRGWTNGLMRQLTAIMAFFVAAFLILHFTSNLAEYLHLEVPSVLQIPIAALLIGVISYNGIFLIGRILFKRTPDQDFLLARLIYGVGGALIGFGYGIFFIWSLLIGVRVSGRIAENQIEIQRAENEPSGKFILNLAKLKNSVELGIGRPVIDAVDPVRPEFYRELDHYTRLIGNPRVIRKMLEYPGFRAVLQDPKILDLQRDPEILADMQGGNLLGVFTNRRVVALLNDQHLRQVFSLKELKAALDFAGNSMNDEEQQ